MICKGKVLSRQSDYVVKVNIPSIHGPDPDIKHASNGIPDTTAICVSPGVFPKLQVGDTVIVGFEDDNTGQPVVLGVVFSSDIKEPNTGVDAVFDSLNVTVNSKLPENTSIGKVTSANIKCLQGLKENVQEKFGKYDSVVEAHNKYFKNIGSILGFTSDKLADADKQFKGPITLPENCYGETLPKSDKLGQIYFLLMDKVDNIKEVIQV